MCLKKNNLSTSLSPVVYYYTTVTHISACSMRPRPGTAGSSHCSSPKGFSHKESNHRTRSNCSCRFGAASGRGQSICKQTCSGSQQVALRSLHEVRSRSLDSDNNKKDHIQIQTWDWLETGTNLDAHIYFWYWDCYWLLKFNCNCNC